MHTPSTRDKATSELHRRNSNLLTRRSMTALLAVVVERLSLQGRITAMKSQLVGRGFEILGR